jgi:hypothetical protein
MVYLGYTERFYLRFCTCLYRQMPGLVMKPCALPRNPRQEVSRLLYGNKYIRRDVDVLVRSPRISGSLKSRSTIHRIFPGVHVL